MLVLPKFDIGRVFKSFSKIIMESDRIRSYETDHTKRVKS